MTTTLFRIFILIFCFTTSLVAEQKEFTILGGQKITAEVEQGMPLPAEKEGIKIQEAAFVIDGGKFTYVFGFTSENKLKQVIVEEVSGKNAITLVENKAPTLVTNYWRRTALPLPLTRSGVPWVFESGDTTKIFRFTITPVGSSSSIVLYQPAIYPDSTKKQLQQIAKEGVN